LKNHLIKELPALKEEMDTKLQGTIDDMEKLGEKRDTTHQQRMVLMKISMRINDILKSAMKGYYEAEFFGDMNMEAPVDHAENIRRFRAVVQHVNIAFANDMRLRGHKYGFGAGPGDNEKDTEEDKKAKEDLDKLEGDDDAMSMFLPKPKQLTREEGVQWVKKTLERSRGYELPGTFQPMLISQLFWEQSQPWEQLAVEHINKVARACKDFVYMVIEESAPSEFKSRLTSLSVDAALAASLKAAKDELRKILKDKARHPSTYNHYFTTTIQKMRQRKHEKITKDAATKSEETVQRLNHTYHTAVNAIRLKEHMNAAIEQDMDVFCSQEALDTQRAYYKVKHTFPYSIFPFRTTNTPRQDELKYFVNAIAKAVIERHLVEPLPDMILSPLVVTQMTDKEIEFVAAEPPEVTQQRAFLEARKTMLEKGLETFREAMGGLKR
jgi:hypothetical protein